MGFGLIESIILNRVPKFLKGPSLGRLLRSYAAAEDGNVEALRQGLTLSNPLQCPTEDLIAISKDRGIPIYASEPEDSKRYVLAHWHTMHRFRGSSYGRMIRGRALFRGADGTGSIPTFRAVHSNCNGTTTWHAIDPLGVYTSTSDVDNFDYDGSTTKWSRTWVFVEMSESDYDAPPKYGDGHLYGDGSLYGVGSPNGFSAALQSDLVDAIQWGGACHAHLTGVILNWGSPIDITAAPAQDADGWWSLPNGANTWSVFADPDTGLATRPPRMQWIYENQP